MEIILQIKVNAGSCVSRTIWSIKCPLGTEPRPLPTQATDTSTSREESDLLGRHPWDASVLLKIITTAQDRFVSQSIQGGLCPSLPFVVWPWAGYSTSLGLSLHSCKRRTDQWGYGVPFVCVCAGYMCVWVCGDQRTTLGVIPSCLTSDFFVIYHCIRQVSHPEASSNCPVPHIAFEAMELQSCETVPGFM